MPKAQTNIAEIEIFYFVARSRHSLLLDPQVELEATQGHEARKITYSFFFGRACAKRQQLQSVLVPIFLWFQQPRRVVPLFLAQVESEVAQ